MKLSIIGGAGTLGATIAFTVAQKNIMDEICLIDIKENIAKSHEMDMGQAAVSFSKTEICSGGLEQLAGSDYLIITAGLPETQVASRMEYLEGNLKIIAQISNSLQMYASDAVIITITNPVDVINSMLYRYSSIPSEKLIGFSFNDSYRFRWALSKVFKTDINNIEAFVLGEHGEEQCPIYSNIFINGEKVRLTDDQKMVVENMVRNWFADYQALNAGRTSGWLSSVNIANMLTAMLNETDDIFPCSVLDHEGISIGRPAILGKRGIRKIVDLDLTKEEQEQWTKARNKVRHALTSLSGDLKLK